MLNWKEKIISGIVVIGVGGMMLWTLARPVRCEKVLYSDFESTVEENPTEDDERAKTGQFSRSTAYDDDSLMPCCDPEAFERWYETYEQETSEESTGIPTEETTYGQIEMSETSAILEAESETPVETDNKRAITLYSFGGEMIEPYLQVMLYEALDRHGISYWYEIGICQMFQESRGNIYAENPNGKDKGILQYRLQFWDWNRGDIFSAQAQFELYAEQMARRINSGLSVDECISRHITSDYTTAVDWQYVSDVRQWLNTMKEVTQ